MRRCGCCPRCQPTPLPAPSRRHRPFCTPRCCATTTCSTATPALPAPSLPMAAFASTASWQVSPLFLFLRRPRPQTGRLIRRGAFSLTASAPRPVCYPLRLAARPPLLVLALSCGVLGSAWSRLLHFCAALLPCAVEDRSRRGQTSMLRSRPAGSCSSPAGLFRFACFPPARVFSNNLPAALRPACCPSTQRRAPPRPCRMACSALPTAGAAPASPQRSSSTLGGCWQVGGSLGMQCVLCCPVVKGVGTQWRVSMAGRMASMHVWQTWVANRLRLLGGSSAGPWRALAGRRWRVLAASSCQLCAAASVRQLTCHSSRFWPSISCHLLPLEPLPALQAGTWPATSSRMRTSSSASCWK